MDLFDIVTRILPLIISIITAVIVWRKAPSEAKKNEAEAASEYSDATRNYLDISERQRVQIENLMKKQEEMEREISTLKAKIAVLSEENRILKLKLSQYDVCAHAEPKDIIL